MLEVFALLGGIYTRLDDSSITLDASTIHSYTIDAELSDKMKASVMFLGPLLVKFGKAQMPTPQGCKLGTRPLDAFVGNMEKMGAIFSHESGTYSFSCPQLQATTVRSREPSVTGTENLILLAVKTPGVTTIYNAACEPHTQDMCNMLVSMGAQIEGIGSNLLRITGVEKLSGTTWRVISDHLDVAGFIAAAAITNAVTAHMDLMLETFAKLGIQTQVDRVADTIHVPSNQTRIIEKTLK
jgi:UDP-N-acetylglucosamine 1-carboxyvinyltransferase